MKMISSFCTSPVPAQRMVSGHEGHHRHVADEIDERFDRRFPAPIAADQNADRQRDHGRDQEAERDPVDADADIGDELAGRPQFGKPRTTWAGDGRNSGPTRPVTVTHVPGKHPRRRIPGPRFRGTPPLKCAPQREAGAPRPILVAASTNLVSIAVERSTSFCRMPAVRAAAWTSGMTFVVKLPANSVLFSASE